MARRKKKLNKNLIAGLTVAGIVLSVVVVAVATYNVSQRDPEFIAGKARELEQSDAPDALPRAAGLYQQAYQVDKKVDYLVESARCLWLTGDIQNAHGSLAMAHRQEPGNVAVLNALLDQFWTLHQYRPGFWAKEYAAYAEALLEQEADNLNALVCRSETLRTLENEDPQNVALADEALERAAALDATHPRVAITLALRELAAARRLTDPAATGQRPAADPAQQREAHHVKALEVLKAAVAAHPGDGEAVRSYAQLARSRGREDEARQALEAALKIAPQDALLELELAQGAHAQLLRKRDEPDPAQRTALYEQARAHYEAALALEPLLYGAYRALGKLELFADGQMGASQSPSAERFEKALSIYADALDKTAGVQSARATIEALVEGRIWVLKEGFELSLDYFRSAQDDAGREAALAHAERYLSDTRDQYPNVFITPVMTGQMALFRNDVRDAIRAFREADEQTRAGAQQHSLARHSNRTALLGLSHLYLQTGEDGLSRQYTDRAIQAFQDAELTPPLSLLVNRAKLHLALGEYQKALDWTAQLRSTYADNEDLVRVQAEALRRLGRAAEAEQLLSATSIEEPGLLVSQAAAAAAEKDYAQAAALLQQSLGARPNDSVAIRLYVQVMIAAEQREPARSFLTELSAATSDARQKRLLAQWDVVLSETDPERRDARIKGILAAVADPGVRTLGLFRFHLSRGQFDEATGYLDEMERAAPDDDAVLEQQFTLALRREEFERAEEYVVKLSNADADRAGGAVFRGQLALARKDAAGAYQAFREAERRLPSESKLKVLVARALLSFAPPRLEEAKQALAQAIEFRPLNFEANKLMYRTLAALGAAQEGVPYLRTARNINPADPYIQQRAEFIDEETNPAQGVAKRERLRQSEPQNVANLVRLGQLYRKTGADEKAAECFSAAAQIDPAHLELTKSHLGLLVDRKDRTGADKLLDAYLAAVTGWANVRGQILRARFYERISDRAAARVAYQNADAQVDRMIEDEEQRRLARVTTGFELIGFFQRGGQIPEVIEACRRVLNQVKPDETATVQSLRLQIVQAQLSTQSYGDAARGLEAYSSDFPDDPRWMRLQAQMLTMRNELEEARTVLTRLLQADRDDAWSRFMRGTLNLRLGRYDEAIDDLSEAKRIAPNRFGWKHRDELAKAYELTERYASAETELREMLEKAPTNQLIASRLIQLYRNTDQRSKAERMAGEFSARHPNQPYWPHQLGLLLMEREEYSAALRPLRRAVELSRGGNTAAVVDWMTALLRAGRSAEAIQAYAQMKPTEIPAVVRVVAAEAYHAAGREPEAAKHLEQALLQAGGDDVSSLSFVVQRARVWLAVESVEKLLERLATAGSAEPLVGHRLRTVRGQLLLETDRAQQAIASIQPVLDGAERGSDTQVHALLLRARGLTALNDYEGMKQAYEDVLRIDEHHPIALNNMAYQLADRFGKPQEAVAYAERALQVAGDNANVLDTAGWVYFQVDEMDRAQALFLDALRAEPSNLPARLHLGRVYARRGSSAEARAAFRRVLHLARERKNADYEKRAQAALDELR